MAGSATGLVCLTCQTHSQLGNLFRRVKPLQGCQQRRKGGSTGRQARSAHVDKGCLSGSRVACCACSLNEAVQKLQQGWGCKGGDQHTGILGLRTHHEQAAASFRASHQPPHMAQLLARHIWPQPLTSTVSPSFCCSSMVASRLSASSHPPLASCASSRARKAAALGQCPWEVMCRYASNATSGSPALG